MLLLLLVVKKKNFNSGLKLEQVTTQYLEFIVKML